MLKALSKNPKLLLKYYKLFLMLLICMLFLLIFRKLQDANIGAEKKKQIIEREAANESNLASSLSPSPVAKNAGNLKESVSSGKAYVNPTVSSVVVNENQLQTNKFQAELYGRKKRIIVVDPACLLLYDTKGKNMCDAPIMIATNDQSLLTASNSTYHYVSFEGDLDSKYLVFNTKGGKIAIPRFATFTSSSTDLFFKAQPKDTERDLEVPVHVGSFLRNYKAGRFLECHPVMTDEEMVAVAETHKYHRRIPIQFTERIAQFLEVLSWFSITGFLFNGSLLGWRRECSIIPHTWDVDIGMFVEQHSQAFIDALKAKSIPNFKLTNMYGRTEDSLEVQVWVDGTRIDLFYIYQNTTNHTSYSASLRGAAKQQIKSIYHSFTDICAGDLHGRLVHLPCDVDKILESDYGAGWRQDEDTDHYFWDKNPKNIEDWKFLNDTEFEAAYQAFY